MDKCFENVCELDLIFHVDKVHTLSARAERIRARVCTSRCLCARLAARVHVCLPVCVCLPV
jgi:hypothetical protein